MSIFNSGQRGFFLNQYGQSGISMDWFQLTDTFTQQLPLKITNTFSGTLWFQGSIQVPRSGYYNFSGIQLGSVASGANATLVMTWDAGVSGWIVSSSPITDILNLQLIAFTSSNYTGAYSSGVLSGLPNTLFDRYSGVIKVFGDIYNNDQPIPSLSLTTGGSFNSGDTESYAISYLLSGWESDIGAPANIQVTSGFSAITVSWSNIVGVSQWFVYRWSGVADNTVASGGLSMVSLSLVFASGTRSFTDGSASIATGFYRMRTWEVSGNTLATTNSSVYLSPPQSRAMNAAAGPYVWAHAYQLNKNISGTNLLGPCYLVFHIKTGLSTTAVQAINTANAPLISGSTIADSTVLTNQQSGVWYRQSVLLGQSGSLAANGYATMQFFQGLGGYNEWVDDVFVVAIS